MNRDLPPAILFHAFSVKTRALPRQPRFVDVHVPMLRYLRSSNSKISGITPEQFDGSGIYRLVSEIMISRGGNQELINAQDFSSLRYGMHYLHRQHSCNEALELARTRGFADANRPSSFFRDCDERIGVA